MVISNIVNTAPISMKSKPPLPANVWLDVQLPVRVDLAGGWSDTPPLCYEHGGMVIPAALKFNGKKPIQVSVRRLNEPIIILKISETDKEVVCKELNDFQDYNQPMGAATLLKSCLLVLKVVDLTSPQTLSEQLKEGGIEVCSHSSLPTGSGCGTR